MQCFTTRLATESDLAALMHLKAEVDYALKGHAWSDAYEQELREYFQWMWSQGQIIIATLDTVSSELSETAATAAMAATTATTATDATAATATTAAEQASNVHAVVRVEAPYDLKTESSSGRRLAAGAYRQAIELSQHGFSQGVATTSGTCSMQAMETGISDFAVPDFAQQTFAQDTSPPGGYPPLAADFNYAAALNYHTDLDNCCPHFGQMSAAQVSHLQDQDYLQQSQRSYSVNHRYLIEHPQFTTPLIDAADSFHFDLPAHTPMHVAYADPLILGLAFVRYVLSGQEGHLYLSKLYVRPAFRSHGIATQILKFAADSTLDFNCHALSLDTNPSLSNALNLYLKHGFNCETPPAELHLPPQELYLVNRSGM